MSAHGQREHSETVHSADFWKRRAQKAEAELAEARKDVERADRIEDALERVRSWCAAYPISVFREPDWKAVEITLAAAGLSLTAVSASNMRHVVNGVREIIDAALTK